MLIGHTTFQVILSIAMLGVAALVLGGISLFRKGPGEHRQKAWLMLAAAIVLLANVLIWTV
ncbi:hypothetical protein D1610_15370 [Sphingomonas gilva]|uniref:Uncharacterized protein n=1 Tax=Sphingomonas gilva TaxID=2305907 RepID=A0A396RJW2_9SPHN|nr:hypothetical protein [Sphingomonas gilva]RHW16478.1 hypothetical protein D1610_15370 [Sphingomonas gilva]